MKSALLIALALVFAFAPSLAKDEAIKDCNFTFASAMRATNAPKEIKDKLTLVTVEYYSFDGKLHSGQLVVDKSVKKDIIAIFKLIKKHKFPIQKVIPIVQYDWSDSLSMADNNTSAFNFRYIKDTKRYSNHARGRAININPVQNPAVYASGEVAPAGTKYDTDAQGTLSAKDFIVREFKKRGWRWGGDFTSFKDWQHFDKE